MHQVKQHWTEDELCIYKLSKLNNQQLFEETIYFLTTIGLPYNCAPGLSFDQYNETFIPTPNQVFNIEEDELNNYLMIGGNGCGDPVCIDLNKHEIVYLNHDNDFERIYINSSIGQLADCLIKYKEFLTSLHTKVEGTTFSRRKFSDEEFERLCNDFKAIDNRCLSGKGCWKAELDYLLWERDNE